MSLSVPGSGLLKTHVTWEDVESELQKAFGSSARLGKNKTIEQIGQIGIQSLVGKVSCDWEGSDASKLPSKIAVKMPTVLACIDMINNNQQTGAPAEAMIEHFVYLIKQAHNNEVTAYRLLRKYEPTLKVPKCYFSVPFSDENPLNGALALELIEQSKTHRVNVNRSVDKMKEVIDKLLPLIPIYFGSTFPHNVHNQFGCGRVLVHGDLWSGNVLFDEVNGDLTSLVDWQNAHFGVGVEDLIRISMSALSCEDRRSSEDDLLNEMYDSMEQNLEGAKAPYTREQASDLYDILFPHAAIFFPVGFTPMLQVELYEYSTEEEKNLIAAAINEKYKGICEDLILYHEKNEKRGGKFTWN